MQYIQSTDSGCYKKNLFKGNMKTYVVYTIYLILYYNRLTVSHGTDLIFKIVYRKSENDC